MSPCRARIASGNHLPGLPLAVSLPSPKLPPTLAQYPSTLMDPQIVFEKSVKCSHAVLLIDLLSFRIITTAVRDSHFVHSAAFVGKLGDNFGFNSKTIFFYLNRLNNSGVERFVARFHICKIDIGENVGEHGQKFVAHHMPEERTRCGRRPMNREPKTASALPDISGSSSAG